MFGWLLGLRVIWLTQCAGKLVKLQEDAVHHRGNRNQSVAAASSFLIVLTEQQRQIPCSQKGYTGVKRVLPELEYPDAKLAT